MLYVIPFIILLVIAVVLKKREASKEEQKPKNKTNANKKGKKLQENR
jgi:cytochrome c-type biogenesis protein CcmH/NrfF